MFISAVIEDHVHHHLEAVLVGLADELSVLVVGAEARVYLVVVGRGIAVIGGVVVVSVGRIILQYGGEPQGRDTQFVEVVQVLADALHVAAMAQRGLRAVVAVGLHARYLVVVRATRGEAVGHQQIEHVADVEAPAVLATHAALLQLVVHLLLVEL